MSAAPPICSRCRRAIPGGTPPPRGSLWGTEAGRSPAEGGAAALLEDLEDVGCSWQRLARGALPVSPNKAREQPGHKSDFSAAAWFRSSNRGGEGGGGRQGWNDRDKGGGEGGSAAGGRSVRQRRGRRRSKWGGVS